MEKGLRAAVRRFPHMASELTDLLRADRSFYALCDDLADAEAAAQGWAASTSPQKCSLEQEYRVLADELATEIESALAERFGSNSPSLPEVRGPGS